MKYLFIMCFSVLSLLANAQEEAAPTGGSWSHESEASVVQVTGNTESASYSAKQKTGYKFDLNQVVVAGRYLLTKTGEVETANSWDASLRYEREVSSKWSAFLQHGAESDASAAYTQRDNTDLGGKYFFKKEDTETFFTEFGLRYTTTLAAGKSDSTTGGRLYLEYSKAISGDVSAKLWAEYIPNFDEEKAYLVNVEPSISVMLSKVFSLKTSYLVKYHNLKSSDTDERMDNSLTTSLAAKF